MIGCVCNCGISTGRAFVFRGNLDAAEGHICTRGKSMVKGCSCDKHQKCRVMFCNWIMMILFFFFSPGGLLFSIGCMLQSALAFFRSRLLFSPGGSIYFSFFLSFVLVSSHWCFLNQIFSLYYFFFFEYLDLGFLLGFDLFFFF